MRLKLTREELREIANGEVCQSVRDRAKKMLDPVQAMIPGQTDLEDALAQESTINHYPDHPARWP